jgi:hypothetical protein
MTQTSFPTTPTRDEDSELLEAVEAARRQVAALEAKQLERASAEVRQLTEERDLLQAVVTRLDAEIEPPSEVAAAAARRRYRFETVDLAGALGLGLGIGAAMEGFSLVPAILASAFVAIQIEFWRRRVS